MKKSSDIKVAVQCPPGVVRVGDKFLAGESYNLPADEANKLIKAGKMVPAKGA